VSISPGARLTAASCSCSGTHVVAGAAQRCCLDGVEEGHWARSMSARDLGSSGRIPRSCADVYLERREGRWLEEFRWNRRTASGPVGRQEEAGDEERISAHMDREVTVGNN
jgi:hypothetical protein